MQRRVTQSAHTPRRPNDPEAGIVLLAAIFLTFLLLLSLAIAAPRLAKSMQRDKEQETIERGRQYEQAIRLYYIKFGHYPTKISELMNTNNLRFLRQKYKDPLTGKDDWKLVLYGQAHVHPLGFFGKPLTAAGAAATNVTALSGGMYAISQDSSIPGAPGNNGNSSPDGDSSNSSGSDSGTGSSPFGNSNPMGGSIGGSAIGGAGFGSTSTATGSSPLSGSSSSSGFGSSSSSSGGFGNTVPFVGVVPPLNKPSIIAFRKQKNYDRWEFNYDPVEDQAAAAVSILGGGASNLNGSSSNSLGNNGGTNSNNPLGGSNSGGNGNGFGNSGFGNSNNNMGFGDSNSNSSNSGSSSDNSNPNPQP
jgi:type II secretory pathway pseudopilin PulG